MRRANQHGDHDQKSHGGDGDGETKQPFEQRGARVKRALETADGIIRRQSLGSGEIRTTEAAMVAWKAKLEEAGFAAEYQRGSGFTRIGQPGAARGKGVAMYAVRWRPKDSPPWSGGL